MTNDKTTGSSGWNLTTSKMEKGRVIIEVANTTGVDIDWKPV
jgi:hypothetical protein